MVGCLSSRFELACFKDHAYQVCSSQPLGGSRLDKHGFVLIGVLIEVSLVFWTGVFLSPGRRIRVTGKETGPGPGGYG